jgi:predicted nucleotidyltransferase
VDCSGANGYTETGMSLTRKMQHTLQELLDRIVQEYRPQKVILFGSYADGHAGPESDIDLLIIKDTSERFIDRWVAVRQILADPNRKVPVDTLVLNPDEVSERRSRGDQFIEEILEKGQILYAR